MRYRNPTLALLFLPCTSIIFAAFLFYPELSVTSQTPDKRVNAVARNENGAAGMPAVPQRPDVVKVDVDLVKVDALVLQKSTARVVGGLQKEDFLIYEDGTQQEITHFSQDKLPLSVLLVIDRGACLDPYPDEVHHAAREAMDRLKPVDEIAVMLYADRTVLTQPFTRNRIMIENALNRIPPQSQLVDHCLNNMFADAADYMIKASNPAGRRVVIVITGSTRRFNCPDGPSDKSAAQAIYESGSVVCGILPKVPTQRLEHGVMIMATRVIKLGGVDYMDIQTLANETGGEVLSDKVEVLDTTFQTLIDHLRSRYNLGSSRQTRNVTAPRES